VGCLGGGGLGKIHKGKEESTVSRIPEDRSGEISEKSKKKEPGGSSSMKRVLRGETPNPTLSPQGDGVFKMLSTHQDRSAISLKGQKEDSL